MYAVNHEVSVSLSRLDKGGCRDATPFCCTESKNLSRLDKRGTTLHITLPPDLTAALPQDKDTLTRLAREALIVRLYALGTISSGKVAQLLNITRRDALQLISDYGVSTFDETIDLEAEVRVAYNASRFK